MVDSSHRWTAVTAHMCRFCDVWIQPVLQSKPWFSIMLTIKASVLHLMWSQCGFKADYSCCISSFTDSECSNVYCLAWCNRTNINGQISNLKTWPTVYVNVQRFLREHRHEPKPGPNAPEFLIARDDQHAQVPFLRCLAVQLVGTRDCMSDG